MTGRHHHRAAGPSRRQFLVASAAVGGGLLVGVPLLPTAGRGIGADAFIPNAFVRVARDGKVIVTVPYVEMGQGTYTSVPMLIAEELEVPLSDVTVEHAPANDALYANPLMGGQETDGSLSMRASWEPMRRAGAAARTMLVAAAAGRWGVPAEDCRAVAGVVAHPATGRRLGYGALVDEAAAVPVPGDVTLKTAAAFTVIGTPSRRLDSPAKVTGKAQFGIDVLVPGMKIAAVAASPVLGGRLERIDTAPARAVRGVRDVIRLPDLVAVVADHWGAARKGLDALSIAWDDGPHATFSTDRLIAELEAASTGGGVVARAQGDEAAAFAGSERTLEATYHVPLLAHAAMEPLNCTAWVRDGRCDVWVGTQAPTRAQAAAAEAARLPLDKVAVHNQYLGGSFGRRAETDNIAQAVRIAARLAYPVKVIWSREEDMQHDFYRPFYLDTLRAGLGADGRVRSWYHRVTGASPLSRWLPAAVPDGNDPDAIASAAGPYDFGNLRLDFVRHEEPAFRTGFWRGVGTTHNVFMVESFMDELAALAGQDPVAFRRAHLGGDPRLLRVLDKAAEASGWGTPLPDRSGRGISLLRDFGGTVLAQVAEVAVDGRNAVRVQRVTTVIDCGMVINPDTVVAQMQGGVIFGLSAALHGEITFSNGRVEQGNFDSYAALRMDEAPQIHVQVMEGGDRPFGVGESGTSGIAPAVANAVFAATGRRVRRLPITAEAIAAGGTVR